MGLPNIEPHRHTGADSMRVDERDIEGAVDQDNVVILTTNQTIAGVKTFSSIPVLPASDPTTDNQAARKAYVDGLTFSNFLIEPSDNTKDSADTERTETATTYTKKKEIKYNEINGSIQVSFDFKDAGAPTVARVYINGSPVGTERTSTSSYVTYTQTHSVSTDDLVQLYADAQSAGRTAYVRNFRLQYTKSIEPTAGTVNQN